MSKSITTDGFFSNDKFDVNMSSIWNELLDNIHFVENYKSDIICDIESVKQVISKANLEDGFGDGNKECVRWIGFRKDGVDHYDYIRSTILSSAIFGGDKNQFKRESYYYYRKLFKLTLKIEGHKMIVELAEKDVMDFVKDEEGKR